MSEIYLDPVAMDAAAGAIGEHAREVDAAVAALETTCSAQVPPHLAGWLAEELHDIAVIARLAGLVYAVAALDTTARAQQIRADQSLATALPSLGAPALSEVVASYDAGGLVLDAPVVVGTRPSDTAVSFVDPGPLVVGNPAPVVVGARPWDTAVTLVHPGPLTIGTSTPVVSSVSNPTWEWEPFLAMGGPGPSNQLSGTSLLPGPISADVVSAILAPSGVRYDDGAYVDRQGDRGSLSRVYEDPYRRGTYEVRS